MQRASIFIRITLVLLLVLPVIAHAQDATCDPNVGASGYRTQGDDARNEGDYTASITAYTCAIELDPADYRSLNRRGNSYLDLRDYDAALADYQVAVAINNDTPYIQYNNMGLVYDNLGQPDEALEQYNLALDFNPDYGASLNNRGNIFYDRGDYERAIEDYERAIAVDYDAKYIPYFNRGISYFELGQYDQALADLNRSNELMPTYSPPFLSRGNLCLAQNDPQAYSNYADYMELIETSRVERNADGGLDSEALSMVEGQVYYFTLNLNAGQIIDASARADSGSDVDPLLVLVDGSGEAVFADDDSGVNLDAVIARFEVPATDTYTLLVSHADWGSDGDLTLAISVDGAGTETFSVYELVIDEQAEVYTTGGDRLNLREGPGLNFDIRDRLESGTVVTLLEGPRKANGYAWWNLRTVEGVEGWSVERVEEEQTLQPLLVIGGQAIINTSSGETLNMREDTGTEFEIVEQLPAGTLVTILEGPVPGETYVWWKIRTPSGAEGWSVERVPGEHTLIGMPPDAE